MEPDKVNFSAVELMFPGNIGQVYLGDDVLCIVDLPGVLLSLLQISTGQVQYSLNLQGSSGKSICHYGAYVRQALMLNGEVIVAVGNCVLYCDSATNSVFPLLKTVPDGSQMTVTGRRGEEILAVTSADKATIYIIKNSKCLPIKVACCSSAFPPRITADGNYVVYINDKCEVIVIKVSEKRITARYPMHSDIHSMDIIPNGLIVVIATTDKRLLGFALADSTNSEHMDHIRSLPSRSFPYKVEYKDIIRDTRFKMLKDMVHLSGVNVPRYAELKEKDHLLPSYTTTEGDTSEDTDGWGDTDTDQTSSTTVTSREESEKNNPVVMLSRKEKSLASITLQVSTYLPSSCSLKLNDFLL